MNQFAEDNDLEVVIFSLTQNEPGDLNGIPDFIRGETTEQDRARYTPFNLFPLDDQKVPKGKKGWLIFIDELSSGGPEMQSACLKMLHERLVGNRKLHKRAFIVGAGNYITDRVHGHKLITAMGSRMVHIHMRADHKEWLAYAARTNHDWRVMAYINEKPNNLHVFDPSSPELTFRCYRTWSDLSDLLKTMNRVDEDVRHIIEGTIGIPGATDFITYARMADKLPKRQDIIDNPDSVEVDQSDIPVTYLLSYLLIDICKEHHFTQFLPLFNKFSKEFQFLIYRAWANNPGPASMMEVHTHPALHEWTQECIRIKNA